MAHPSRRIGVAVTATAIFVILLAQRAFAQTGYPSEASGAPFATAKLSDPQPKPAPLLPGDAHSASRIGQRGRTEGVLISDIAPIHEGVIVLTEPQIRNLQLRAENGEPEAQFIVGAAYRDGGPFLAQNDTEALKWFQKAADQGFPKAQTALGYAHELGRGVPRNYPEAARWYGEAARQGYAPADYNLGVLYLHGHGVARSESHAFELFNRAAREGVTMAQCALGFLYRDGRGVRRDLKQAFQFQRTAAEKGLPKAQNELGVMYLRGEGVRPDLAEALRWFTASAQQGNPDGQNNLGYLYETGQGVKKDFAEAFHWLSIAAERGHPAAQLNLADMYANGRGVRLDYIEAYKWFTLAAAQKLSIALKARKSIGEIMTKRQIDAAQMRVAAWQRGHVSLAAK